MAARAPYLIDAKWDSRDVKVVLSALAPKQWTFAQALALTRTAQSVKSAEKGSMRSVFDRPTPFTLNSLQLQAATRNTLEARVWFKDPPRMSERDHYLMPQVYGGARTQKRFEGTLVRAGVLPKGRALVPASGVTLDAYGNVPRSIYSRILANLQASPVGANTNTRKKRRNARDMRFFYGNPGGKGRGIWQRFAFAWGGAVRPIFLERRSMPQYRQRFGFFDIAERTAGRVYQSAFEYAAERTLKTAR